MIDYDYILGWRDTEEHRVLRNVLDYELMCAVATSLCDEGAAFAVLEVLRDHADPMGRCHIGDREISASLGWDVRRVRRKLALLIDRNVISRVPEGGRGTYRIRSSFTKEIE
jgi:hypothetical protein